jgi:uncharacterized membrane protein
MKNLTIFGRIVFALPFAILGLNHFFFLDYYIGNLSSFIPLGPYTVMLTGIFLIMASISIVVNKYVRISTILLATLLLIFILSIHIPGLFNKETWRVAFIELLKDTSLMGGSLMIAGMVHEDGNKD